MAINAFDKPVGMELQPLDWDFLGRMQLHKRAKQDKDFETNYNLQKLIGELDAMPDDRKFKKELDDHYTPIFNKIASKISSADPSYKQDLIKTQVDLQTDPRIQTIRSNKKNWDTLIKQTGDYQKTDEYDEIYDPYKPWYDQRVKAGDQLTPFDYQGMMTKQDFTTHGESLMTGAASESVGWENYARDKNTGKLMTNEFGQLVKRDGTFETLSEDKIKAVANQNLEGFLIGKGGRYFVDRLFGRSVDYKSLPEDLKKQVDKTALDYLTKTGMKHTFVKQKQGIDLQNLPEGSGAGASSGNPTVPLNLNTNSLNPLSNSVVPSGSQIIYTNPQITKEFAGVLSPSTLKTDRTPGTNFYEVKSVDWNKNPQAKEAFELAKEFSGSYPSKPEDQISLIKDWTKYINSQMQQTGLKTWNFQDPKQVTQMNNAQKVFIDNGMAYSGSTNYILMGSTGNLPEDIQDKSLITGADFAKSFGDQKADKNISGKLSPDNPYAASGLIMEVKSKDGSTTQLAIPDQNPSPRDMILHELYKAKYNGTFKTKFKAPSGNTFKVEYSPELPRNNDLKVGDHMFPNSIGQIGSIKASDGKNSFKLDKESVIKLIQNSPVSSDGTPLITDSFTALYYMLQSPESVNNLLK